MLYLRKSLRVVKIENSDRPEIGAYDAIYL